LIKLDGITLALSGVMILVVMIGILVPTIGIASATTGSVNKIQSGLVSSDSFTTGNTSGWTFGGTATLYDLHEDSQGLHLGVQSPKSGQWVNHYAAAAKANAHLFHAGLTIPYASVADGVFNPGLYVEGSNYAGIVGCQAYADHTGYYWIVQYSTNAGSTWNTLYAPPRDSLPQTEDCTVMTNGNNYLNVYIGGKSVFSNSTMNLNMPTPLHAFVQVDTSSSSMDNTTYSNYYSTTDENIQVTNNPSNATTVQIVGTTGNVLATAPVSAGTATLNVGMYQFPLAGTINVYDSNNSIIASSSVSIYGGDVYSVTSSSGTPTAPQPPTGLTATAASTSQVNLSWTAPANNGGSAITGYKIERSQDAGTTWSIISSNTGSAGTTYANTGLSPNITYTYRVSAINSVGTSVPSNTASATTNGTTSNSIVLNNVQTTSKTITSSPYQITISNFNAGTGTNRLLVVGVDANNKHVTSVTFGGVSLTKATSSFHNDYSAFWYLTNPSGTGNIVVTMAGATSAVVGAYSISGVDQTTPIPTSNTNHDSTTAGSPTISITTQYPNSMVLDLPSIYGGVTLGSSTCAQQWDVNIASAITGASSSTVKTSAGLTTCNWIASGGGDLWDDAAIEIKSSGTGTTATVPGSPTGLTATSNSTSQINLSWTAPSSDGGSVITGYDIERSTDNGTTWSTVQANTGSTGTTYSDAGLSPSTTYTYRISAINSVGTSTPSNIVSSKTQSIPITVPQPPTGLTATAASTSQVNLSWTAPSDNGGSAITGYQIERSSDSGTTWSFVQSNTNSTSAAYSDMGLNPSTSYTYRVSAINSVGTSSPSNTASATTNQPSLTLMKSGLLVSDSLSNETATQQQLQTNSKYWIYGGDAIAEKAPYAFWRNMQGLHTGVQAPSNGTWAGIYSVSRNTPAMLYHSVITTPVQTIPGNNVYYNNGMYVQTNGSNNVNYVTCTSNISSFGTVWAVFWATGNPFGATSFTRLWYDPSPNQPLTRDCTIITNGNNYLKVYMDGVKVVDSTTMNLQMPGPFNVFLEPQSSYDGQLLNGTFTDYYASAGENVTVTNLPSNTGRVDIVDSSGNILATSQAANQIASLDVGQYHFPLSGTIKVYDSNNALITSRPSSIYGGDVYSVNH